MKTTENLVIPAVEEDTALSKGTKKFLAALNGGGGPAVESLSPAAARQVLIGAQESVEFDYSGITESEKTIEQDGFSIKLNIVKPKGAKGDLPVFIFLHGGGWVLGDYPTHKRMVRDLVVLSGAAGVFVNYTPSPEARFPQAINEIFAATKWVAAKGAEIAVDGTRLAIVGNSVGGNMTAVTAIKAKEEGGPEIKLQIMMWPVTNVAFDTYSYARFGKDRFLTTSLMKWMFDNYTTDPDARKSIYVSPLNATLDQLKGLPPALIQVADADILRDEGEAYGRKLDEAGVPVTTIRYNGTIHDFGLLNPLAAIPQTKSLFLHAAAELKKYLFLVVFLFSAVSAVFGQNDTVRHFKFSALPTKKINDQISRGLISGKQATIGYFTFNKGAVVPLHHHVNEQYTIIMKGSVRVTIDDKIYIVKAGEGIIIPSNVPHLFESLENGTIDMDFFSPPRQDWIDGTDSYFNKPTAKKGK
jgi:acetyl esterase/lipase/quercetin dioxygenase-like cupin family protein